jgi:hypothetical protein
MATLISQWQRQPIYWSGTGFLLLAAAALFLAIGSLAEWRDLAHLRDSGVAVPAHIISSTIDTSGRYAVDVVQYDFRLLDGTAGRPGDPSVHHLDVGIPERIGHARLYVLLFLPTGVLLGIMGAILLARGRTLRST